MDTYSQFLEARSLSEALLLKHSAEGTTRGKGNDQIVARAFQRLALQLGYTVEKIDPDTSHSDVLLPRPGLGALLEAGR